MSNNYLDVLNKLKFNPNAGDKQKIGSADPNILTTYSKQFADKNPEYEIRIRLLFDMERSDPNPAVRNWHSFKSAKDGSWIGINCPAGRCPICNATFSVWSTGDAFAQDRLKKDRFMRSQNWYLNCYVVDNPVDPSQNGSVKIVKLNKPIMDVFKRATSGRDAKRFGNNIFRLDDGGNTLVISIKDVRGQGGDRYPNFTDTYFADAEDCKSDVASITDDMIEQIYKKTFNLGTYFKRSTPEEAEAVFREHVYPAFADILGGEKTTKPITEKAAVQEPPRRKDPPMPTKPIADTSIDDDELPFDPVVDPASVKIESMTDVGKDAALKQIVVVVKFKSGKGE
jgi:hypothetical protein